MSEFVETSSFDVESQQSLLESLPDQEAQNCSTSTSNATRNWLTISLLIRSVELFKLGAANNGGITSSSSLSSATTTTYASISIPDQEALGEVAAAPEISVHEDVLSAHSASAGYDDGSIELQCIQRNKIADIVKQKDLDQLRSFGGVGVVAEALNTDLEKGISSPHPQPTSQPIPTQLLLITFFHSFLAACNNITIFLLSCAAILSLCFGIKEEGWHMGWFNGVILTLTVFVLVLSTSVHDCWKERSGKRLENSWPASKGRKMQVKVIRAGELLCVEENALVVGDIAFLRKGDLVPADGLFVTCQASLEVDEGFIKSTTIGENNPFLFYGSRVMVGEARMLVTSTRMDTVWGEIMSGGIKSAEDKMCKLESYIQNLSYCIHITTLLISILIIIVMFLRYKVGKLDDERRFRPDSKGEPTPVRTIVDAIKGIITGCRPTARVLTTLLSVSLMGVMEGMPLVISVATIMWSRKTLSNKAFESDYLACLKMASVTTICTDKFGGLSEHTHEINNFYVGQEFVSESSVIGSNVLEGLCDGIGSLFLFDGHTEVEHIISWAEVKLGMRRESVIEECKMVSYSGEEQLCQVVMEKSGNRRYLHCKGKAEQILSLCKHQYDVEGQVQEIDGAKRRMLEEAIRYMQLGLGDQEAQVIAFACKCATDFDQDVSVEPQDLIFLGMISLRETKTEETKRAISSLMDNDGIRIVLASGDDVAVLATIGQNCELITPESDDLVLTAEEFRSWSDDDKKEKANKIRVMGNCLPSDKILLTKCLREQGEVVALVAQRTIDAPALRQADIGLTFGTWTSDVARECCDITIWDGNCLSFLANVVEEAKCYRANIKRFIQLQLIIAVSSSLVNFTAIVFLGDAPLTAAQLLWLNLVFALAGMALLTGTSSRRATMNKAMWRNIAIQVSYQTAMFVTLQHKGQALLGTSRERVKSVIYNGFFLCQLCNKLIAREPEKKNIFSGLVGNNSWFWVALVFVLMCQGVFEVAEQFLGSSPGLSLKLWGVCLLIGVVSWVFDWVGKVASDLTAMWASDQNQITGNGNLNSMTRPLTAN